MAQLHTIIIHTENRILAEVKTDLDNPLQLLDLLEIYTPTWYPIPGGWLITNRYTANEIKLIQLTRGHGFEFMGVHYYSNAIMVCGGPQDSYGDFPMQPEFADIYQDQVNFFQNGYDREYDQGLNLGLGIEE